MMTDSKSMKSDWIISDTDTKGPDCWKCQFLKITYMPATPYGCTLMGFRSKWLPSLEVLRADGQFCQGFIAKAPKKPHPTINIRV